MNEEDNRTRIQRLLNYKRYIDWLVEQELKRLDTATDGGDDE